MRLTSNLIPLLSLAVIFAATSLHAAETIIPGNCSAERFQDEIFAYKSKYSSFLLMVLQGGAELYRSAAAPSRSAGNIASMERQLIQTLMRPVAVEGDWVQVSRDSDPIGQPYGWMRKRDLLCTKKPLVANRGPELLFYVKTVTSPRSKPEAISAYDRIAKGDSIARLSRFQAYYILDRQDGRVLLSQDYYVDENSHLVGWVDEKNGFVWNSAFGIRPNEDLPDKGKPVCAHLPNGKECIPILGGSRWYKIGLRIPALKLDNNDKEYQVILPISGTGACHTTAKQEIICPEGLKTPNQNGAAKLRHFDIMFLIDGTRSMQNYIEKAKTLAKSIVDELMKNPDFKDTKIRFAFRIFRDRYAGSGELGEGLPFGYVHDEEHGDPLLPESKILNLPLSRVADCETPNTDLNVASFEAALAKVKVSTDEHDDFSENLYGGIKKAVMDLRGSCKDNLKVLFVIGDSGYDAAAQRTRGGGSGRNKTIDRYADWRWRRVKLGNHLLFAYTFR